MPTSFSTNLALALPATGELSGTWGTTVNSNITNMLDEALGYQAYSATGGADTLTIPDGTTGVARSIYIQLNGTGGGTVNVPTTKTKMYFVFNNTASAITFKVTGQTGVSIPAAAKMALVSNGTDIIVAQNYFAALTLGAALPVASGGTGTTTPSIVAGTNVTVSGTWPNQTVNASGTVSSVAATVPSIFSISGSPITTSGTLAMTYSGTALPVANGGTSLTTLTANNVILGNGASAPTFVAPSTSGNVLTSNGTTWVSSAGASVSAATPTALGTVYAKTGSTSPFQTSVGYQAGNATTGVDNTFMGYQAGQSNTSGTVNTAIGSGALRDGTTSNNNTAVGYRALFLTTADGNTAVGDSSLDANTSGDSNVAIGQAALGANTTASKNTAVGSQALRDNTTGSENTGVGTDAGQRTDTGIFNTSVGSSALYTNTSGGYNTSVGRSAAYYITTGTQNTVLGTSAGASGTNNLTTGSNNTIIGYNAAASAAAASNEITFGNASITKLRVPGLSVDWDADAVPFRNIPQNSQSAAYTLVAADAGKHIFHPSTDANARTYTIPANSSVAYAIGTAITFINMTSQVVTIAITSDTMYLSSAGTTGSRSLAQYGSATAIKMTSTTWLISGSALT